jgi:hypothetical protein
MGGTYSLMYEEKLWLQVKVSCWPKVFYSCYSSRSAYLKLSAIATLWSFESTTTPLWTGTVFLMVAAVLPIAS